MLLKQKTVVGVQWARNKTRASFFRPTTFRCRIPFLSGSRAPLARVRPPQLPPIRHMLTSHSLSSARPARPPRRALPAQQRARRRPPPPRVVNRDLVRERGGRASEEGPHRLRIGEAHLTQHKKSPPFFPQLLADVCALTADHLRRPTVSPSDRIIELAPSLPSQLALVTALEGRLQVALPDGDAVAAAVTVADVARLFGDAVDEIDESVAHIAV